MESARTTKATIPFPRGRLRGRGDTADKKRHSPASACPLWSFERRGASFVMTRELTLSNHMKGRQADGTAHARTRGNLRSGDPSCLFERNGMHGTSGYRVRMDAEHATPLAGPTYRARTRYRLAGPRSAGETLPAGTWDRPAVPRWNPRASAWGGCQM